MANVAFGDNFLRCSFLIFVVLPDHFLCCLPERAFFFVKISGPPSSSESFVDELRNIFYVAELFLCARLCRYLDKLNHLLSVF